jgi:hypothetical protein
MYLTKSRFKMAIECPTKLFYSGKASKEYFDQNKNNDFLQALADVGQQVGELAKLKYHDDPFGQEITVETLEHDKALEQTDLMLKRLGRVVIAEAAVRHQNYFVRVDILIRDDLTKTIELIEVKSKSVKKSQVDRRFKKARSDEYDSDWLPYLYDVAYQKMVVALAMPDYKIIPKLLLIDASQKCDVDGLHQLFPVAVKEVDGRRRTVVSPDKNLKRREVGGLDFLLEVDVADVVEDLLKKPVNNPAHIPSEVAQEFSKFVDWSDKLLRSDQRYFHGVSSNCKTCQFRAPSSVGLKSGVHECWREAVAKGILSGDPSKISPVNPLSIDLWGGGRQGKPILVNELIKRKRALLKDVEPSDFDANLSENSEKLSPDQRRVAQIQAARNPTLPPLIHENRIKAMDAWEWPLHMIDFETTAPAVPFFKGLKPSETLAFQFSHHILDRVDEDKIRIRHAKQWISTKPGAFPNIDFVRALKEALMPKGKLDGTVFRYHNHENSVLLKIRESLIEGGAYAHEYDALELIAFIELITKPSGADGAAKSGDKAMVNLHEFAQETYYSSFSEGSISLKFVLPAILRDAPGVARLYSNENIYGKNLLIPSLNFDDHVWLSTEKNNNPYKTLPPIFDKSHTDLNEMLSRLSSSGDEEREKTIDGGGLAMSAYNYTQYNSLKEEERNSIAQALFRYCELDTLAMVMLVQGLYELRKKPLEVVPW